MATIIGLDIGGTSYKLGAWHGMKRLTWQPDIPPTTSADADEVADYIALAVQRFASGLPAAPTALGIGSCGLITGGVIWQSPNTPWDHLPLTAPLSARLGTLTTLINDADAFLLDAMSVLPHTRFTVIGLTLGTGVGTAVWLGDRLLVGGSGISPEAGHITINYDGPLANTLIAGSWESLACRAAVLEYYFKASGIQADDPKTVTAAAQAGDSAAREAWERFGTALGAGLASLTNIFSPHYVLLGGGLAGSHGWFEGALRAALQRFKLHAMPTPELVFLDERADAVAHGAARYAELELAR